MHEQEAQKRKPDEHVAHTEMLFQTALHDLKTHNDTDVDFERLFALVDIYNKFYETNDIVEKRWFGYTQELVKILSETEHQTEAALKQMIDIDRPMKAYQKSIDISNNGE
jgi:hypothetical protein